MAILRKSGGSDSEWGRCPACAEILPTTGVRDRHRVCPGCGYHYPLGISERMSLLLDDESFEPQDASLVTTDVLRFKGVRRYKSQLAAARKATGSAESVRAGEGRLEGRPVAVAFVDGDFLAGSLGSVAMARLCRVFRRAESGRVPALVVTGGGRLRHAEGAVGMSQLPVLAEARDRLRRSGGLFLSVIVAPLPTGAACTYAFTGDVNLAEPGVGDPDGEHPGPEGGGEGAPAGVDALLATGLVDRIVERAELKAELSRLMGLLA